MTRKSSTETLIAAMRILARDIQSGDGVANAAIAEAADRLAEQLARIAELEALANVGQRAVEMLRKHQHTADVALCESYCAECDTAQPKHANNCELAAILRDAADAGMGVES